MSDKQQLALLDDAGEGRARRGPGRPPGARNRRAVDMIEFLERTTASPLEQMAAITRADVAGLMRIGLLGAADDPVLEGLLDRKLRDALNTMPAGQVLELAERCIRLKVDTLRNMAPFWHSRMPTEVEDALAGAINAAIGGRRVDGEIDGEAMVLDDVIGDPSRGAEIEGIQGVGDDDDE